MTSVWISDVEVEGSAEASASPAFIVQVGGVYYITKAVWAFDKSKAAPNTSQADDCDTVKQAFGDLILMNQGVIATVLTLGFGDDLSHTA